MTAPGGWRVVPIRVERGGRTLDLYRVSRHGVFVCECRTPAEVAAAGVPMDELREEPSRAALRELRTRPCTLPGTPTQETHTATERLRGASTGYRGSTIWIDALDGVVA